MHTADDGPAPHASLDALRIILACGGESNHIRAAVVGLGDPDHTAPFPPLHLSPVLQTACAWAIVGSALACRAAQLSSAEFVPSFNENVAFIALTNGLSPPVGVGLSMGLTVGLFVGLTVGLFVG